MSTVTLDTTTVRRWKLYPANRSANSEWIDVYPESWIGLPLKRWVETKITDGPHEPPPLVEEVIDWPRLPAAWRSWGRSSLSNMSRPLPMRSPQTC